MFWSDHLLQRAHPGTHPPTVSTYIRHSCKAAEVLASALAQIYLIGGYGENYDFPNATEMYDPVTDRWSRVADIPTPRGDLMCTALNGLVYAIGGYYVSHSEALDHRPCIRASGSAGIRWVASRVSGAITKFFS